MNATETIRANSAGRTGLVHIDTTITPGANSFTVTGANSWDSRSADRIRDGITGAGYQFPDGTVTVAIDHHRNVTSTLDLATACAILAPAKEIKPSVLNRIVCLGELGADGYVNGLPGVENGARTAHANGYGLVLVSAQQSMRVHRLDLGLDVVGVWHLREAITFLNAQI